MLRRFSTAVMLSWGWRRHGYAAAAGAVSALAQAPLHLGPVLFLTIPVLVWLVDGCAAPGRGGLRRIRPAAVVGWWFGFGYFLAGLWWVGAAFLVEAETFGWMMPFALVALPAGLALFHAAGVALARAMWVDGPVRVVALAIGLSAAEFARGHLFTGFPWNLLGQAVAFSDLTSQAAAEVGVYGLTLLGLIVFSAPAVLADGTRGRGRARAGLVALSAALVVADVGYGAVRLASAAPPADRDGGAPRVRIVQPAIDQSRKWDAETRRATLDTLIELSEAKPDAETLGAMSFSLIVWPETALPFFLTEEPDALARIGRMIPAGTLLVTGAPRVEPAAAGRRFYNSVYVVADGGRIVDAYDKVHLVPFGEYLPAEPLLARLGLSQLAHGVGGFSAGAGLRTIDLPGLARVSFLVCYEIIFPGRAHDPSDRPDLVVNLTNDAWFGRTPGPYQHLDLARLRAIEEGLPVVRAANDGVSAIIDPYGRVTAHAPRGVRGVADGVLPAPLQRTNFSRYGAYSLLTLYVFSVTLVLVGGMVRQPGAGKSRSGR